MKHRDPDVLVLYHIIYESIIFQIIRDAPNIRPPKIIGRKWLKRPFRLLAERDLAPKKYHRMSETRWRPCSTYAGPVSGAVLPPQNAPKAAKKTSRACMVAMVALLFILRTILVDLAAEVGARALALFLPPRGKHVFLL